jgi:hypothetical protein
MKLVFPLIQSVYGDCLLIDIGAEFYLEMDGISCATAAI